MILLDSSTSDTNPFKPVLDFFDSALVRALIKVSLFALVVLWISLAFWTFKDARRRVADPILIAVAVATALIFGPFGCIIYLILRPPEYLDDVRERELEIRAMERRLGHDQRCSYCRSEIEPSFLSCPTCMNKLKVACRRCKSPLDPDWRLCPYCETVATTLPPPERPRRGAGQRTTTEA